MKILITGASGSSAVEPFRPLNPSGVRSVADGHRCLVRQTRSCRRCHAPQLPRIFGSRRMNSRTCWICTFSEMNSNADASI